ncbi:MAG: hypothetical protein V4710_21245, partial [Verrucomicrobiota bacterium]
MIRGLIEKELRQHGLTFLSLLLVLAGGLTLIIGNKFLGAVGGTPLYAAQLMQVTFVPIACLVLSQILVVIEFRQKTQLFLEGLPLPRWRMIAIKYALGLALVLTGAALILAITIWDGRGNHGMTPRFLLILALRSGCWCWFVYNLFFAHAFLGRYRLLLCLLVLAAWIILAQAKIPMGDFAPLQLIGTRFPHERGVIPVHDLAITASIALGLLAGAFCLGLVRDATIASLLADKMSSREKSSIGFLLFGLFIVLIINWERMNDSAPIRIPGAHIAVRDELLVTASAAVDLPTTEENAILSETVARLSGELSELAA